MASLVLAEAWPGHDDPILVRSGESSSKSRLHSQLARLRSVSAVVSSMLETRSSGCPCQRGQLSYRGHSLRPGRPCGAHDGLPPDRKARSARHSSRTSSSLTLGTAASPSGSGCRDRQRRVPHSGRAPSPGISLTAHAADRQELSRASQTSRMSIIPVRRSSLLTTGRWRKPVAAMVTTFPAWHYSSFIYSVPLLDSL